MHKVILFRGGMCGDLLLSMLDKKYVSSYKPLKQIKDFVLMKKFYNYTFAEKNQYFKKFIDEYTLSHDTDYCYKIKNNVIQLYCSDKDMLYKFSERFWNKNDSASVAHVITDLKSSHHTKIEDYKNDISNWQSVHIFKKRFDMKDVFKTKFVKQVKDYFNLKDTKHAALIHSNWLKLQNS